MVQMEVCNVGGFHIMMELVVEEEIRQKRYKTTEETSLIFMRHVGDRLDHKIPMMKTITTSVQK